MSGGDVVYSPTHRASAATLPADQVRRARLEVARRATGEDDLRTLLEMLGLDGKAA